MGNGERAQIQEVVDDLQEGLVAGDGWSVCAELARAVVKAAVRAGGGDSCWDVVKRRLRRVDDVERVRSKVLAVPLHGRIALAEIRDDDGGVYWVRFVRERDAWVLPAIDLRRPSGLQPERPVDPGKGAPGRPRPFDAGTEMVRPFRLEGGRWRRCPSITRVEHSATAAVTGGCALRFVSDDLAVLALTGADAVVVARCRSRFVLHMADSSSSLLADRVAFRGPGRCRQVRRCRDGETGLRYPWQGSKVDGPFTPPLHLKLDICIRTPVGHGRGMLHFALDRHDGDWTATIYDQPIGDGPVQLSGRWDVTPDGFQIRPGRL